MLCSLTIAPQFLLPLRCYQISNGRHKLAWVPFTCLMSDLALRGYIMSTALILFLPFQSLLTASYSSMISFFFCFSPLLIIILPCTTLVTVHSHTSAPSHATTLHYMMFLHLHSVATRPIL
ncbi:uncharacterized protein BJ212DRAFT_1414876, partial [Suillus subaureus]